MGSSKRGVRGERRSSGRIGRETAVMDERQRKGTATIKVWRRRGGIGKKDSMMNKMSKKEIEKVCKDGERRREWME